MINNSMKKTGKDVPVIEVSDPPTNQEMIAATAQIVGVEATEYAEQMQALQQMGILTDEIISHMSGEMDTPMAAEAVMIVANLYQYMAE